MPRIDAAEVASVRQELDDHLRLVCKIPEPGPLITEALETMRRAESAATAITAESMAFRNLEKPLNSWLEAHVNAEVVRDTTTHEARDEARTNAKLVEAVAALLELELERRGKLDRAAALDSASTRQRRGGAPTVEWFTSYAVQRGFDATALMLLEAIAIADNLRLRPAGKTYWHGDRDASEKQWKVLIRLVLSASAQRG